MTENFSDWLPTLLAVQATADAAAEGLRGGVAMTFERFGAVGDGVTDDADAIQAAIDFVYAAGGGTVTGLADNYKVDATRVADAAGRIANLVMKDGVYMQGRFKLTRGTTAGSRAVIWLAECTRGGVSGIEIDANDAAISSPTVHGIFKNRNLENYNLSDLIIRNTSGYGIGLQDNDGIGAVGYTKNCRVSNVRMFDIGDDGIDVKDNNADTGNNTYTGVVVDSFALDASTSGRVGIHVRGVGDTLSDLRVTGPGPAALRGIAIQSTGDIAAISAKTICTNFFIDVSAQSGCQGFVCDANNSEIIGGFIKPGAGVSGFTIASTASNVGVTAVQVSGNNADTGGFLTGSTSNTNIRFTACSAIGNDTNYNIRGDDTHMVGCRSAGSITSGIRFDAGISNVSVRGGRITVASGAKITFNSVVARIADVAGFKNKARVEKTGLLVDAIGNVSSSITHGLDVTPAKVDVTLTNTGASVNDYALDWLRVASVTSTVVNFVFRVGTASATGGATIDIGVKVDSEVVT